jgi:hypothetical protein
VQHRTPAEQQQGRIGRERQHAAARAQREQQEHQRQREQQVGAAEDHRLGRAEAGHPHVVQRHRHRDGADQPAQHAGGRRSGGVLFLGHAAVRSGA